VIQERDHLPRVSLSQWGESYEIGPVVVVAIHLDVQSSAALARADLRGWMSFDDLQLRRVARRVSQIVPFESVVLSPRKWNTLLGKLHDRDRLLNWSYRRALTSILNCYVDCSFATFDYHSPAFAVLTTELPRSAALTLSYRGSRESDLGLAAAGVLAKATFVRSLEELSTKTGQSFPPLAVDLSPFLATFLEASGAPALLEIAKKDDPRVREVLKPKVS